MPAGCPPGLEGISGEAARAGVELAYITETVLREREVMDAVRHSLTRAHLVIVTGPGGDLAGSGSGPAEMLKKTLSRILERRLILNEDLLERSRSGCATGYGAGDKAALLPSGAVPVTDPDGCPAGFYIEVKGRYVVYVERPAGHPAGLVPEEVAARLKSRSRLREHSISSSVRTFGVSMSALMEAIREGFPEGAEVFARECPDGIDVTVTVTAETASKAAESASEAAAWVAGKLGDNAYATGEDGMEAAVARLLTERGMTIATAESCTGGLIAKRLTDVPGSTAYMERGLVTYSNLSKTEQLGVPKETLETHGAVSEETVKAMAEGVRWYSNTDLGLAVTGIAGPGGGTDEKPVGLVYIGLATEDGVTVKKCKFAGGRAEVRYATSQKALDMVRRRLVG